MRILVASDGSEHSEHVIRHAIQFARHIDSSEIRVIYVIDTTELEEFASLDATILEKDKPQTSLHSVLENVTEMIDKKAEKTLMHIKREIEANPEVLGGTKVEFSLRKGEPSEEILKESESYNADLIIMGSLRLGSRLAIGSTADRVIRGADVPVMVVGSKSRFGEIKKMLVPVDKSDSSKTSLKFAAYLAERLGASLKLLHVVNESTIRYFSSLSGLGADEKEVLISEYVRDAEEYLKELSSMDMLKNISVEISVVKGDPIKEIIRESEEDGSQLIVMSTRGMGHLGKFFIGSVTGGVISQANRPVLVVKG